LRITVNRLQLRVTAMLHKSPVLRWLHSLLKGEYQRHLSSHHNVITYLSKS